MIARNIIDGAEQESQGYRERTRTYSDRNIYGGDPDDLCKRRYGGRTGMEIKAESIWLSGFGFHSGIYGDCLCNPVAYLAASVHSGHCSACLDF